MIDFSAGTLKMIETDHQMLSRTLREVEQLLDEARKELAPRVPLTNPLLQSLCRAHVRVLFLLLQLCPSHLSTLEFLRYHSQSLVLRRFLQGGP